MRNEENPMVVKLVTVVGILSDDLAFSSNLVDLLSQRELRSKYIERGLLRAEELSFERMLDQYEKLFQNVNEGIGE